jgi:hypothetical protein
MRALLHLAAVLSICSAWTSALGQDVKIDNNYVRITETAHPPGLAWQISAAGFNRLLIGVGVGDVSLDQNGHREQQHWTPGHAVWIAAGQTLGLKNAGPEPLQVTEVELKTSRGDHALPNPKMDPVVIDPEHNILVLDNEQIRVFRSWREPGATEKLHEHVGKGRIAVLLTGLDATVKTNDGAVTVSRAGPGDVLWSGPVIHATTNLGSQRFEMLIVEVK